MMHNKKLPTLYFMIGLPGSGKSTWARETGLFVRSSDETRESLLGSRSNMKRGNIIFNVLNQQTLSGLKQGISCVYDATNTTRLNRVKTLNAFRRAAKFKAIACFVNTPLEVCLERNATREHVVPESMIRHMAENLQPPCAQEGWDEIRII